MLVTPFDDNHDNDQKRLRTFENGTVSVAIFCSSLRIPHLRFSTSLLTTCPIFLSRWGRKFDCCLRRICALASGLLRWIMTAVLLPRHALDSSYHCFFFTLCSCWRCGRWIFARVRLASEFDNRENKSVGHKNLACTYMVLSVFVLLETFRSMTSRSGFVSLYRRSATRRGEGMNVYGGSAYL